MTLGGFSAYRVRCLLSAVGRLDLSVARPLSNIWLMLKHAPRHLQNTCVVLRAHRVLSFSFGSFRLALKAPGQVKKFPNEFADRVSGYMVPTADHMVRAYYQVMLLRGGARVGMCMC